MACIGKGGLKGDSDYMLTLEQEYLNQTAPPVRYFSLNRGKHVDALYGEPDNDFLYGGESPVGTPQTHDLSWNFCPDIANGDSDFYVRAILEYVEFDNRNVSVRPEGKQVEWDAMMSMSVNEWECSIEKSGMACMTGRKPKEGDVLYAMEEWWDVVKVGKSGYVLASPLAVGYKFELRKRSQFVPERKVDL